VRPPNAGASVAPNTTAFILTTMTVKSAALLSFVGTIVMTVLLVWNFVSKTFYKASSGGSP
jgi:hypothetical protein